MTIIWLGSWQSWVPPNGGVRAQWGAGPTLQLSGRMDGPGNASSTLDEITAEIRVLHQFHLGRERMPATGSVFRSAPIARLTGDVYGSTWDAAWFDDPSATCTLRALQLQYVGGAHVNTTSKREDLITIVDENPVTLHMTLPSTFAFEPLEFVLNRQEHLQIDLDLRFAMRLEGDGQIRYDSFLDRPPLTIHCPQWDIYSIA
jgi:hypothetical protein